MSENNPMHEICLNCEQRRGLHNFHDSRCPKDANAAPGNYEYRNSIFKGTPNINEQLAYWKQRCEAAEKLIETVPISAENKQIPVYKKYFTEWQSLKQKQ